MPDKLFKKLTDLGEADRSSEMFWLLKALLKHGLIMACYLLLLANTYLRNYMVSRFAGEHV